MRATYVFSTTWNLPEHTNLDQDNEPLHQEQEQIGKQYIWDGWLSMKWQLQQEQIWKQLQSHKSSHRWMAEIIKKLWNVAWNMWEQWNGALHESPQNRENILEKDVNNKIWQIYAVGPGQLAQVDIGKMKNPLEHQLSPLLATKQQWLKFINVALIWKSFLHEYGTMVAEQRLMETW